MRRQTLGGNMLEEEKPGMRQLDQAQLLLVNRTSPGESSGKHWMHVVKTILGLAGKAVLGGCVAFTFCDKIGHPAYVRGNSMLPTLRGDEDIVWLSAMWEGTKPEKGDIVTFRSPRNRAQIHIKRCAAVENELIRPKKREHMMIVPEGQYWMESDNPYNSLDSNVYGSVSRGLMIARATCVIWPPSRWQLL
ncbi:unnamed protein product, partial [Mesorhabditis spiculigera]